MMNTFKPRVLVFGGSMRAGSFNKKLSRVAADALRRAGAEVTWIDLREFPMPVYDGDLEEAQGLPENARKLKALFVAQDAIFLSSPEYNSSIPGTLKNAIDWVSRPEPGEADLVAFDGKWAALVSASPGWLGGMRALVHVRALLQNIGTFVLPDQFSLSKAHEAFNDDGTLKNPKHLARVEDLAGDLVRVVSRLSPRAAQG